MLGVMVTGLGVSGLYPLTLGLAVESALNATDLASSKVVLASGMAILLGPFLLAALADAIGIRLAFSLVPVLLLSAAVTQYIAPRLTPARVLD